MISLKDASAELDEREVQSIRSLDHGGRSRRQVARWFEGNPCQASLCQSWNEGSKGCRVISQGVGGRQEQFVRLYPLDDVRDFHDVHRTDEAVQAGRTTNHLGVSENREPNDIGEADRVAGRRIRDSTFAQHTL